MHKTEWNAYHWVVVFLHGGPGGETSKANTVFFNPKVYRVVLFDQRGVGKSRPRNELRGNNTHRLLEDIEKLREHLTISKWHMVFGGSWGSTLGLIYTQTYPSRVGSLVIRGVFTARRAELAHSRLEANGAALFYPEMKEKFLGFLPEEERDDPVKAYYKRLTCDDPEIVASAAREWNRWDLTIGNLARKPLTYDLLDDTEWCLTHALLESHYFAHGAWLEDGQLLAPENVARMKHIPGKSVPCSSVVLAFQSTS